MYLNTSTLLPSPLSYSLPQRGSHLTSLLYMNIRFYICGKYRLSTITEKMVYLFSGSYFTYYDDLRLHAYFVLQAKSLVLCPFLHVCANLSMSRCVHACVRACLCLCVHVCVHMFVSIIFPYLFTWWPTPRSILSLGYCEKCSLSLQYVDWEPSRYISRQGVAGWCDHDHFSMYSDAH